MQDPYDDEDYDENDDYDYPYSPYKWYYKFDVGPDTPISNWLNDMMSQWISPDAIEGLPVDWKLFSNTDFPIKKFPVNSWNPNTVNNKFQYLGSNYAGEPIWKSKYFVCDTINLQYKQHIQANAAYFLQQPSYYKGLQDILN
jgi:hypothetical protein